jgi:hypothetical protein
MNGYRVNWPPQIRDQLLNFSAATLSGTGRETAELNHALTEIEEALQRTPTTAGESRDGGWRVIVELPLSVDYRVNIDAREVLVLRVHYSRGRRP